MVIVLSLIPKGMIKQMNVTKEYGLTTVSSCCSSRVCFYSCIRLLLQRSRIDICFTWLLQTGMIWRLYYVFATVGNDVTTKRKCSNISCIKLLLKHDIV